MLSRRQTYKCEEPLGALAYKAVRLVTWSGLAQTNGFGLSSVTKRTQKNDEKTGHGPVN